LSGKTVSIDFISSTEVAFNVDGEFTNTLEEGQTQKLSDGSYLGVKDIRFSSKDGTLSSVEFSIGTGKLKLTNGADLEVNEDTISGLGVTIIGTNTLSSIAIAWSDENDDLFITTDSSATMPVFGSVKLSFGGINYPLEEVIEVKAGGDDYMVLENFPLRDSVEDIPILYGSSSAFTGIGKSATDATITVGPGLNLTWNKSAGDNYFVVSWSDGNDGESYLVRANNFDAANSQVDFEMRTDGSWTDLKTNREAGDTFDVGNAGAQIKLFELNATANNQTVLVGSVGGSTDFHTLYSKEGMKVYLPYSVNDTNVSNGAIDFDDDDGAASGFGHNASSFYLVMYEEDKDNQVEDGDWINVTIDWNSDAEVEVKDIMTSNADADSTEIGDSDIFRDFTYSALATEILWDKPSLKIWQKQSQFRSIMRF
ncbi:MAG: hypothetical protein IIC00_10045, partial [Planctomycetes bacterium]|nr:hypothetical protein [Planctomycetota bacterium]